MPDTSESMSETSSKNSKAVINVTQLAPSSIFTDDIHIQDGANSPGNDFQIAASKSSICFILLLLLCSQAIFLFLIFF